MKWAALILMVGSLFGQNLPDAPEPQKNSHAYSWWDYSQPQMTYKQAAKDPWFLVPALTMLAMNSADIEATLASGCGEAQEAGRIPTRGELYRNDFIADGAVLTMAYFMHKSHIRLIPQGMMTYGIVIHTKGFVDGLHANCH